MSRHHRRLLRRLRAAWSSRGAAVSLRRDPGPDGRWRVAVVRAADALGWTTAALEDLLREHPHWWPREELGPRGG